MCVCERERERERERIYIDKPLVQSDILLINDFERDLKIYSIKQI